MGEWVTRMAEISRESEEEDEAQVEDKERWEEIRAKRMESGARVVKVHGGRYRKRGR